MGNFIIYKRNDLEVILCGVEFSSLLESVTLKFRLNNDSDEPIRFWIKDLLVNDEEFESIELLEEVSEDDYEYAEKEISGVFDVEYSDITDIEFCIEIDDEDDTAVDESDTVYITCDTDDESYSILPIEIEDNEEDEEIEENNSINKQEKIEALTELVERGILSEAELNKCLRALSLQSQKSPTESVQHSYGDIDNKTKLLLESFDVLKTDYSEHTNEVDEIIMTIAKKDFWRGMDMWKQLIDSNPRLVNVPGYGEYWSIISSMFFDFWDDTDMKKHIDEVLEDRYWVDVIFGKNQIGCSESRVAEVIGHLIKIENFEKADECMHTLFGNRDNIRDSSFGKMIERVIDYEILEYGEAEECEPEIQDLVSGWVQLIDNKKEKAAVMPYLIKLS